MNHRYAHRSATQISPSTNSRPETKSLSKCKTDSKREMNRPFIEDFNMEHSCSAVTVSLIAFSDSLESATTRNPYTQSASSPTCVYLG
jgi:hypothetical protein